MIGNIKKMQAVLGAPDSEQPVQYQLPIGDELVAMNEHIGQTIKLHYHDEINCVACGRKTKTLLRGIVIHAFAIWHPVICAS